jgi:hypothetical protein
MRRLLGIAARIIASPSRTSHSNARNIDCHNRTEMDVPAHKAMRQATSVELGVSSRRSAEKAETTMGVKACSAATQSYSTSKHKTSQRTTSRLTLNPGTLRNCIKATPMCKYWALPKANVAAWQAPTGSTRRNQNLQVTICFLPMGTNPSKES